MSKKFDGPLKVVSDGPKNALTKTKWKLIQNVQEEGGGKREGGLEAVSKCINCQMEFKNYEKYKTCSAKSS